MPEIVISAVLGALAAAATYFIRGRRKYRWWSSWMPKAAKLRWMVIGVGALIGGAAAMLGEILASIAIDQTKVEIGAGIAFSLVAAFATSQATDAVSLPFAPLYKLISEFETDMNDQVLEVIHQELGNWARSVGALDGLVDLCRDIHNLAMDEQKYNDDNRKCDLWGGQVNELETSRLSPDEVDRRQSRHAASNIAIQMIIKFQTKRTMVEKYMSFKELAKENV